MYDYVLGKVDWMARGLPVEGKRGPYVGDVVVPAPTCRPDERVADVDASQAPLAVVAGTGDSTGAGVAIGRVDAKALADADPTATILDVMEIVPDTLRPRVPLSRVDQRVSGRFVTNPDGVLLGMVDPDFELPPPPQS